MVEEDEEVDNNPNNSTSNEARLRFVSCHFRLLLQYLGADWRACAPTKGLE